jgi:prevent-host-death family protein
MYGTATEIKNSFGKYLKACEKEDVYITKNNKVIAKLISYNSGDDGYLVFKEESTAYSYSGRKVSYEEFLEITNRDESRYEYLDGEVYLLASPGMTHQLVHSFLYKTLALWFDNKKCQVFSAPFDITLDNHKKTNKNVLQPDLLVACDYLETRNKKDRYMGIPALVIEIISPGTRSRDMVKKLYTYMVAGIQEYWVVDPENKSIMLYTFIDKKLDAGIQYKSTEVINSIVFEGLSISVNEVFENV